MNSHLISNTLIRIIKGTVIIRKCLMSFKLLTKSQENQSVGVIADQDTKVTLEDSELTGSESHYAIGMLIKNSDVTIKKCLISGFKQSGIIAYLQTQNFLVIMETFLIKNYQNGFEVIGEEARVIVK